MSRDLDGMKWSEFRGLLSGMGPDTPLGRIVAIRAEDDKDILRHFTKEQRRIRSEWRKRQAEAVTGNELDNLLESLKQAFVDMSGGGRH